jgi:hypothetical protein
VQRFPRLWLTFTLLAAVAGLWPISAGAQDDPNEAPLGDVARSLRKKTPASQDVIDNDNLPQVMDQVQSNRGSGSALKILMAGESKSFQVSAPDVTCSLSFSANTKALLTSQYAQMDLPPHDVVKLEGPATIEGDALTVSVFNGTDWHVSEVAVAFTIVKKKQPADRSVGFGSEKLPPAVAGSLAAESEVRPEKRPDVTVIYRMRSAAPPFATTVFSAPLNLEIAPSDEWHWAIVQAKGYPPQTYAGHGDDATVQTRQLAPVPPALPPALLLPQGSPAATVSPNPQ